MTRRDRECTTIGPSEEVIGRLLFSGCTSSGALDTGRLLFTARNCSFKLSLAFLSDCNTCLSCAISVRYSSSARSNDSLSRLRLSCNVVQLVHPGGDEVSLSSSVASMHPSLNPTKVQNNVKDIYGRSTEFHREIVISYLAMLTSVNLFQEVLINTFPRYF